MYNSIISVPGEDLGLGFTGSAEDLGSGFTVSGEELGSGFVESGIESGSTSQGRNISLIYIINFNCLYF